MKRFLFVPMFAVALVTVLAGVANAQVQDQVLNEVTLRGTVEAIDYTARTVRIRGVQGNVVNLEVPASVVRFDQVKVGDMVTMSYYDRVAIRRKPAGEAAVDTIADPKTTPSIGTLPGGTLATQRIMTVTLTGWDPSTRMVSYTGPKGGSFTRYISPTIDPALVAGLKIGDRVDVIWTEALRLEVEAAQAPAPAAAAVPAPDAFRHRTTVSVQWGLDNQFSGNMIKAATGHTAGGAPINLTETTFDDVYGRMDLFKVGIGYRTSPRTEVVFNYVNSGSSSQTVNIGTITTANLPLLVDFEDFSYWGFEGGQRWYFLRTRFTPYAGYLVGANRFGDIRGVFVNLPTGVAPPGYAAQDGKFFEKSWALSVGPTGGLLFGIGPIEVMAEVQFRFMGGLSDVDWLVEEGLKDINTESSRWSFPILFGARVRF